MSLTTSIPKRWLCHRTPKLRYRASELQEPWLAAAELRCQGYADSEDRRGAPRQRADHRDQADRAEDQDAEYDHGDVAAEPPARGELFTRACARNERSEAVKHRDH